MAERRLFLQLSVLHALVLGSYGVVAPAAQSLFLSNFAAKTLPWAWIAIMLAATASVVSIRGLARWLSAASCLGVCGLGNAAVLLILLWFEQQQASWASFAMFVWRDVYVLILLELFWMYVNLSSLSSKAASRYGWISAAGTLGAVAFGAVGASLSQRLGTAALMATMAPVLVGAAILAWRLPSVAPAAATEPAAPAAADGQGHSPSTGKLGPIWGIFAMVAVGHACLTLLDFVFSQALQQQLPDADHRTKIASMLQAGTNGISFVLQAASGPLMRRLPTAMALAATPLVLSGSLGAFVLLGGFGPIACAKALTKALDHSFYRTSKELLYLPLAYRDKTAGKAWVDIAGSRLAKAAASVFLLLCAKDRAMNSIVQVTWVATLGWAAMATWVATAHLKRVSANAVR